MLRIRVCLLIVVTFSAGYSASNCKFAVKLEQYLMNEGFHRNITYSIVFDNSVNHHLYENCIIGLEQGLPAGVFANPDELSDFRRLQKLSAVPLNRVNVELPAEESQPTSVYIISQLNKGQTSTWLPVHARYHHATSDGGYVSNKIQAPRLFLRCPDRRLDECDKTSATVMFLCNVGSKERCIWREVPVNVMTATLSLNVPVGNMSTYRLVVAGTSCIIMAGSLYLLKTLHEYKMALKKS